MKAKEYFNRYKDKLYKEYIAYNSQDDPHIEVGEDDSYVGEVFFAFIKETKDIIHSRHSKKDEAVVAVIREQNQKWNVMARLLEKEYGDPIVNENAVLTYFSDKIPEIKQYLKEYELKKAGDIHGGD